MNELKIASRRVEGIYISAITGWTVDQAECVENTQPDLYLGSTLALYRKEEEMHPDV